MKHFSDTLSAGIARVFLQDRHPGRPRDENNVPNFIEAPNRSFASPNLNPLDYGFTWNVLERSVNGT